jgi:biotin carboxylase
MVAESPGGRAGGTDRLTLVILGGGPSQRQATEAARRLGLRTVVCDGVPGVGDVVASTEDAEAVLTAAREAGADGIIAPGTDWPVLIAAEVADELGLPHPIDVATARRATDKIAQREAFDRAGVPQPDWSPSAPPGYPGVVKAADRQGQRTMAILTGSEELQRATAQAREGSRSGRVLFERFVAGPEVTVNGFSGPDGYVCVAVTDRHHFEGSPGVAQRHVYPSEHDTAAAAAAAKAAVEAIGIEKGPSYVQLILSPDGPRVIEVAARLGGGHDSEICRRATGIDLATAAVRAALGEEPAASDLEPRPRGACVIEFLAAPPGVLKLAEGPPGATFYHPPGHRYGPIRIATDRAGYVIAEGATREEALKRSRSLSDAVRFEVE